MEFGTRKKAVATTAFPSPLQLYRMPPSETICLDEFEELAEKRLKVLKQVEEVREKAVHNGHHKTSDHYQMEMWKVIKTAHSNNILDKGGAEGKVNKSMEDKKEEEENTIRRRRDNMSHYILRLAYSRTEEMRRWFLSQETELLRCRYIGCSSGDRDLFLRTYAADFNFQTEEIVSDDEQFTKDIISFYNCPQGFGIPLKFKKVPFTAALDLVQFRQVVLKNGYAYLPENNKDMLVSLICNKFRARVSEELVKTLHHLAVVDDDERIAPLLKNLKRRYLGEDFNSGTEITGQVHPGQINGLSKESFAPCMRHLHDTLRSEHHLRHFGRLQYGLFLKSIGMSLEDALTFWRSEFTKKMDVEKFDKQYAYNVRHGYGKEGKRANYTPYSCLKIIMSNTPSQGDHHGCPFRHWDRPHLSRLLHTHGLSSKEASNVEEYVGRGHYQLACQRYFEITHRLAAAPFSLEHPTQYFLESRKVRGSPVHTGQVEPESESGGMESRPDSTLDVTADISMQDIEDLDKFDEQ